MRVFNSTINYETTYETTPAGDQYIKGIVPDYIIKPYLKHLKTILSRKDYKQYTQNQQKRDSRRHHMTIVNPLEYKELKKDFSDFVGCPIVITCFGIGKAQEADNEAYFIVCSSQNATSLRSYLKLPKTNFHITLGFKTTDIFNKPKDLSSLIYPYSALEN